MRNLWCFGIGAALKVEAEQAKMCVCPALYSESLSCQHVQLPAFARNLWGAGVFHPCPYWWWAVVVPPPGEDFASVVLCGGKALALMTVGADLCFGPLVPRFSLGKMCVCCLLVPCWCGVVVRTCRNCLLPSSSCPSAALLLASMLRKVWEVFQRYLELKDACGRDSGRSRASSQEKHLTWWTNTEAPCQLTHGRWALQEEERWQSSIDQKVFWLHKSLCYFTVFGLFLITCY